MLTLYLTVTLCMVQNVHVCKEYRHMMTVPTPHACIMQGMQLAQQKVDDQWKLTSIRCSRKQEFGA